MIALVDSGVGNLRSVHKALEASGAKAVLTSDPRVIIEAKKVALPGVGAFGDTMMGLDKRKLIDVIRKVVNDNTPLLGICVGMQVLFETSDEMGEHQGLGFFSGCVQRFVPSKLKIPHTGWNQIHIQQESPLLSDLPPNSYAYFNHSYYCDAINGEDIIATTEYGLQFPSVVQRGNLYGVQFHPEKSQDVGLKILRNFVEYC